MKGLLLLFAVMAWPGVWGVGGISTAADQSGEDPRQQEEGWEGLKAVQDAWITAKVMTALALSKSAQGSDVQVSTRDGIVTLKGTVENRRQEGEILELVRDVVGVRRVVSYLATPEEAIL